MNFIQQAYKGKNEFWRFLITSLVVMSPFILNIVIFFLMPELFEMAMENNNAMNSNVDLFVNLIVFAFFLGLLFVFVKLTHQRSITSLVTSRKKVDWKRVFFSFFLWFSITAVVLFIGWYSAPENYILNFDLYPFIGLVVISFLLMPLQTSFEELLFRGYLMQQIGIIVKNRWFPLITTSVLFGLMHGFNPEVEKLGPMVMVYYIGTGLFLAILTLMDEGTELALGFHAANNIAAAIFITTNWTVFQTEAILIDTSEPTLGFEIYFSVFIIYPLLLVFFSKKYAWKNWKNNLFGKIEKPNTTNITLFEEDSMLEI